LEETRLESDKLGTGSFGIAGWLASAAAEGCTDDCTRAVAPTRLSAQIEAVVVGSSDTKCGSGDGTG
jgi:hypothetical protein